MCWEACNVAKCEIESEKLNVHTNNKTVKKMGNFYDSYSKIIFICIKNNEKLPLNAEAFILYSYKIRQMHCS